MVWNEQKINMHGGSASTYEELLQTEKEQDCSWSSEVSTDDIKGLIAGVYNETDVDLHYVEVK